MKWLCVYLLPFTLLACTPKDKTLVEEPLIPSEIKLADVSSDNCLNLEKFSRLFQDPLFSVPAAIMTTDLKAVSEMPSTKLNYFSYATFYYKTSKANEMGLFNVVRQKDCKTVQMLTASEEVMTYEVKASSEKEITIKLTDKYRDTMNSAEQEALFERQQPYEYTFTYINPNRMIISEKYTTVDVLCTSKKPVTLSIRKELNWAGRTSDLPQVYTVETSYLNQVKESLMPESQNQIPVTEVPENLSVGTIQTVMQAPLKAELKLCVQ